jgi:(4S)-4-hydroxy-5-phosphonooxypentane-2,3-dione isomerase
MFVACIHLHVKSEHRQAFLAATLENARQTIEEPGNLRFDVLQLTDDPNRFMYYEVYRDEADMKAHKETAHYARWAATVPNLLAEPRSGVRYESVFPEEARQWSAR